MIDGGADPYCPQWGNEDRILVKLKEIVLEYEPEPPGEPDTVWSEDP